MSTAKTDKYTMKGMHKHNGNDLAPGRERESLNKLKK